MRRAVGRRVLEMSETVSLKILKRMGLSERVAIISDLSASIGKEAAQSSFGEFLSANSGGQAASCRECSARHEDGAHGSRKKLWNSIGNFRDLLLKLRLLPSVVPFSSH